MATFIYNHAKKLFLSGVIDLQQDNICVMLVSGSYAPNKDSHKYTGDIGSNESQDSLGTYKRGGAALTAKVVSQDDTDDEGVFDANDISWSPTTMTASGAVLWYSGSTPTTCYLLQFIDLGGNQSSSNGTFQITWNTEGIINLSET